MALMSSPCIGVLMSALASWLCSMLDITCFIFVIVCWYRLDHHAFCSWTGVHPYFELVQLTLMRCCSGGQLEGQVGDCECSVDTVDFFNNVKIFPRLQSLLVKDFFRFYKVRCSSRSSVIDELLFPLTGWYFPLRWRYLRLFSEFRVSHWWLDATLIFYSVTMWLCWENAVFFWRNI